MYRSLWTPFEIKSAILGLLKKEFKGTFHIRAYYTHTKGKFTPFLSVFDNDLNLVKVYFHAQEDKIPENLDLEYSLIDPTGQPISEIVQGVINDLREL